MSNPIVSQILRSVIGSAMQRRGGGLGGSRGMGGLGGSTGGGLGGAAVGSVLAGMAGRRLGGRGTIVAMLLPFAMQWVQRNGGLGAVLQRVKDKGMTRQAQSWVSTGENESLDPQAVDDVVGREELSRLSQQLGVPQEDVRAGFAEILPEMVDQFTPDGELKPEADDVLKDSIPLVEQELDQARR